MTQEKNRNREQTEKKLLNALEEIIIESGFEHIKINSLAARAGVSKVLIYRYFGSLDGLIAAFVEKRDYWMSLPKAEPQLNNLGEYLKLIFKQQIVSMREDSTMRRLYRWELSKDNELIHRFRKQREITGISLCNMTSRLTKHSQREVASVATLISAAISYLLMLEDFCPQYNGINLQEEDGWLQIEEGVNTLIDLWLKQ